MSRSLPSNVLQCVRPVVTSLKDRFVESSCVVYENIESLLLKTIKSEDTFDESKYIKRIYNNEIILHSSKLRLIFFAFFSTKRKWIALIASCLRFGNFQESNVYFFHTQFTFVSSYSSIQPLPEQQSGHFPLQEEQELDASQNVPSEIYALSILHSHKTSTNNLN